MNCTYFLIKKHSYRNCCKAVALVRYICQEEIKTDLEQHFRELLT